MGKYSFGFFGKHGLVTENFVRFPLQGTGFATP